MIPQNLCPIEIQFSIQVLTELANLLSLPCKIFEEYIYFFV